MRQAIATPGAGKLFGQIKAAHQLKSDAALSRMLDVVPPQIANMRAGRLNVGPVMIIKIEQTFGLPIRDIKAQLVGAAP